MKVLNSILQLYEDQFLINELLKNRVDQIISNIKEARWHYESRLKSPESFALKLETGRIDPQAKLEDFFACTLVVENAKQIKSAINKIKDHFIIKDKRPPRDTHTHKESSSFIFDDLRIYCLLRNAEARPKGPIHETLFEIQIKTFLQHAWTIATHDLIYKSNEINWSKERVAYQIKAMLEQAELAISGVNNLISLPEVAKDNKTTKELKRILFFYQEQFSKEELPNDLIRLCKNTQELLFHLDLSLEDVRQFLLAETAQGRGSHLKNLSPYFLVLQSICKQRPDVIQAYNVADSKFKLVKPAELDCGDFKFENSPNIIPIG